MRYLLTIFAVFFTLNTAQGAALTVPAFSKFSSAGMSVDAGKQGTNTMQVVGARFSKPGGKPTMTITGPEYRIGVDFLSIAAAVSYLGSTPATVYIPADTTLTANVAVPATLELIPLNGAVVNHGAYTVAYAGSTARWARGQVLNGTGLVSGLATSESEWFGAKGDGVTVDTLAFQRAASSLVTGGTLHISPKTYNLAYDYVTVPAGITVTGTGILLGGITVGGDNVAIKGVTVRMTTGLNGGNLKPGITSTDFGALTLQNVVFDKSALSITNGKTVYKKDYSITGCHWMGDVTADAYAQSISLGNVDSLEFRGNTCEQEGLYRIIKLTSIGYSAADTVTDNYNKGVLLIGNFFRGSVQADQDHIDTYSSATKLVFAYNICDTTGGADVLMTKGGTGPYTTQHRDIIIAHNIVNTDVSQTVFNLQGAYGLAWEGTPQNINLAGNQITSTNPTCTRGISVTAYHRAIMTGNDVNSTSTAAFYGIAARANKHTNISGGILTKCSIIVSQSGGDPNPLTVSVNGATVLDPVTYRAIDISGLLAAQVSVTGTNTVSTTSPVRIKDCTLANLTVTGNVSSLNGLEWSNSTATGVVNANNSWDAVVQTLTGAGAVSNTTKTTHIVTTAVNALTLADGWEGQTKYIVMKTDGGNGTLTPANFLNGTTITFDDVGDSAQLLFTNGKWVWLGGTATKA